MAAPTELNLESVRVFILQRGGQVSNQEIAKHFRQFLKDPTKPEQKELFKDIVKVIAIVKKVNDEKIIKLRNDYSYAPLEPPSPVSSLGSQETFNSNEYFLDNEVFYDPQPIGLPEIPNVTRIIQSQSSPDILLSDTKQEDTEKLMIEPIATTDYCADSYSPTAPPRKKSYKENKKPRAPQPPEQNDSNNKNNEDDEQTPRMSVKEQASKLNKIASESQINLKPPSVTSKRKDKVKTDDETTSVSSATDPQSREFFLKCAQGDYHTITRLLRDDPELVKHKDVIYTALHWAAKRGHSDMVKLIAGTFGLSTNIRSGYTPLHLAAIHNHRAVYDLLIQTYGADASLRDYGGKRALQLFKDWKKGNNDQQRRQNRTKANAIIALLPQWLRARHSLCITPLPTAPLSDHAGLPSLFYGFQLLLHPPSSARQTHPISENRDVCFLRIGSLNVKVRKTTELFSLPEVNLRKGWGSADSVTDGIE